MFVLRAATAADSPSRRRRSAPTRPIPSRSRSTRGRRRARIFHVVETIPAAEGNLALAYPKWIPGEHAPDGPIEQLVGLKFMAGGEDSAVAARRPGRVCVSHRGTRGRGHGGSDLRLSFSAGWRRLLRGADGRSGAGGARMEPGGCLYPAGPPTDALRRTRPALRLPRAGSTPRAARHRAREARSSSRRSRSRQLVDSPVLAGAHSIRSS